MVFPPSSALQGCTRTGPEPAKRNHTGTPVDNADRNTKSLAPERADPEWNVSPDRTGPDRNANHVPKVSTQAKIPAQWKTAYFLRS